MENDGTLRQQTTAHARLSERHPLRVLLVEDNLVNQKVAQRLLDRLGYRADVVTNGQEGLEALRQTEYDLVLMDVQMPVMDGLEATRRLRRELPVQRQPYVVAVTANAMKGDREQCLAAGMDDYVPKPIRLEDLVHVIERCPQRPPVAASEEPATDAPHVLPVHRSAQRLDPEPASSVFSPDALREMVGDDEAFIAEILTTFIRDAHDLLDEIRNAVRNEDAALLQRAAHSLKSTTSTLGIHDLADRWRDVERHCAAERYSQAVALLPELEGQLRDLLRAVENYLRRST